MHCAAAAWEDLVYNLARPLKSLRLPEPDHPTRRWLPQTPAMAAGLTDHLWSLRQLLFAVPLPVPLQLLSGRLSQNRNKIYCNTPQFESLCDACVAFFASQQLK